MFAEIESCAAPAQYARNGPGTWIVMVGVGPTASHEAYHSPLDEATPGGGSGAGRAFQIRAKCPHSSSRTSDDGMVADSGCMVGNPEAISMDILKLADDIFNSLIK